MDGHAATKRKPWLPAASRVGFWGSTAIWVFSFVNVAGMSLLLGTWKILAPSGSPEHHPLFGPYVVFSGFLTAVSLGVPLWVAGFVRTRKRDVIRVVVGFYPVLLLLTLVDFLLVQVLVADLLTGIGRDNVAGLIADYSIVSLATRTAVTAIMVPYYLYSAKAAERFVLPALPAGLDSRRRKLVVLVPVLALVLISVGALAALGRWRDIPDAPITFGHLLRRISG